MRTGVDFDHLKIFEGLSAIQRELVLPLFVSCDTSEGDVLFEQGDPAEYLYLVVEGGLAVRYKPYDGPPIVVARIQPGGMVGWSAAMGRTSYTSSVDCLSDCLLLKISRNELRLLYRQNPETCLVILDRLALVIAQRLDNTYSHVLELIKLGICQETEEMAYRE